MRITNRIIQNNSLSNINNNKVLQDNLSTQLATEKKISRPSEDPIIALRSLRLRTSVNQTEQYRAKNAEDAESWLEVTEDAINTLSEIITDIRKQYVKGASDPLTPQDRRIILENIQSLGAEIYNSGNADFAGRTVFTGFRTSTTLTFQENEVVDFKIYEKGDKDSFDTITYVHDDTSATPTEQGVYRADILRYRTSYDALKEGENAQVLLPLGTAVLGGVDTDTDGDGTNDAVLITPTIVSKSASPDPYQTAYDNPAQTIFIPETGEILFGADVADAIKDLDGEIGVTYSKDKWNKGDLRPEHYFKCEETKTDGTKLEYNFDSSPEAEICYNIGVNQSIRINTNASECFTHNISRDIDDLVNAINDVDAIELKLTELTARYNALSDTDPARDALKTEIDAAKKTQTFLNKKLSDMFSHGITKAEGYLTTNNLALTNCGTRSKRLELIQNRLDTQLSTLKELKSENEDVDMAEAAVKLSSAQTAYDASLMSTSKILKESLLNYL